MGYLFINGKVLATVGKILFFPFSNLPVFDLLSPTFPGKAVLDLAKDDEVQISFTPSSDNVGVNSYEYYHVNDTIKDPVINQEIHLGGLDASSLNSGANLVRTTYPLAPSEMEDNPNGVRLKLQITENYPISVEHRRELRENDIDFILPLGNTIEYNTRFSLEKMPTVLFETITIAQLFDHGDGAPRFNVQLTGKNQFSGSGDENQVQIYDSYTDTREVFSGVYLKAMNDLKIVMHISASVGYVSFHLNGSLLKLIQNEKTTPSGGSALQFGIYPHGFSDAAPGTGRTDQVNGGETEIEMLIHSFTKRVFDSFIASENFSSHNFNISGQGQTVNDSPAFAVLGLEAETAYRFTQIARDTAGNRSGPSLPATHKTLVETPDMDISMSLDASGAFYNATINGDTTVIPDVRWAGKNVIESEYINAPIRGTVIKNTGNDQAAFIAAVNEAKGSTEFLAGQKVRVFIPNGTYLPSVFSGITDSNIILYGESREGVIIDAANHDMGSYKGIFDFLGGVGSNHSLTQSPSLGATRLYVPNASFEAEKYAYIQKRHEDPFMFGNHAKSSVGGSGKDLYAMQVIKVVGKGNDGNEYIDLQRPLLFDIDHTKDHRIYATDFLIGNGLMNMTLIQSQQATSADNRSLLHIKYCAEFLIKDVDFKCSLSHYVDPDWVGQIKSTGCTFDLGWFVGNGGGRSYVGWWKASDCILENFTSTFGRHLAIQNFSRGCVIRTGVVEGQDINFHNELIGDSLIEQITINDNAQPLSKQGEVFRNWYAQIGTNIPTEENSALGAGIDNRVMVYNCDFDGRSHGGGWFMGGLERDLTFAFCRLQILGNSWQGNSWHDGQAREPAFMFSVPCERLKLIGNVLFIPKDQPNTWAVVRRGTAYNESASPDVHILKNTFCNFKPSHRIKPTIGVTESGNTWLENIDTVPDRPTPPTASIYQYQLSL